MKFLKWLLIVLVILAGLILIVPVFMPSSATVSAETEIELDPWLVFNNVALYTDRSEWDPWLNTEPSAKHTIVPAEGYVGSTYQWEGEKIGNGKMQVDSISSPGYIRSLIWFGDSPEPSVIEWIFKKSGGHTHVTWKFTSEGSYPFGRYMLLFMKGPLSSSFESGLSSLKKYLEENPPVMYRLSEIKIEESYETDAMVVAVEGTIEEIGAAMQSVFPRLYQEVSNQGLNPNGPPFAHYLDFDEETATSHVLLGAPVDRPGKAVADIKPRFYPRIRAVVATHQGDYQYFNESYAVLDDYIKENGLEVTGEAFELYMTTMMDSTDPMDWETRIAFPLK